MNTRRPLLAVLQLCFVVFLAACENECETSADCDSGAFQCVDNACVLTDRAPLPDLGFLTPIDVGPRDFGFPDTRDFGFVDLGFRPDMGFAPMDAGFADASDGALADGGDASAPTGQITTSDALVVVETIQVAVDGGPTTATAEFFDYTGTGRVVRIEQGCTVTTAGSGSPTPLTAGGVSIRNGQLFTLTSVSPGVFEYQGGRDPALLLAQGNTLTYEITSAGSATGALADATATTGPPVLGLLPFIDPRLPILFTAVNLIGPAQQLANRFEIYDELRTTVVECPMDPNTTNLPFFIANLYPSGSRVSLEVRNDADRTINVAVAGRGTIPVTFRASRGARYMVDIP